MTRFRFAGGSYSGRVVVVDENGEGLRVYDIGSVPQRIIDTGEYVYLLTGRARLPSTILCKLGLAEVSRGWCSATRID